MLVLVLVLVLVPSTLAHLLSMDVLDLMAATQLMHLASRSFMSDPHSACRHALLPSSAARLRQFIQHWQLHSAGITRTFWSAVQEAVAIQLWCMMTSAAVASNVCTAMINLKNSCLPLSGMAMLTQPRQMAVMH